MKQLIYHLALSNEESSPCVHYLIFLPSSSFSSSSFYFTSSLMVTNIPMLLWGWLGKSWPRSFMNRSARPDVSLRLGQGFIICWGCRRSRSYSSQRTPWDLPLPLTNTGGWGAEFNVRPRDGTHTLIHHPACETPGWQRANLEGLRHPVIPIPLAWLFQIHCPSWSHALTHAHPWYLLHTLIVSNSVPLRTTGLWFCVIPPCVYPSPSWPS